MKLGEMKQKKLSMKKDKQVGNESQEKLSLAVVEEQVIKNVKNCANEVWVSEDVTGDEEYTSYSYKRIHQLFEKKGSKILKEKKDQVKITNIKKHPYTYAKLISLLEERTLAEQSKGSKYQKTSSPVKKTRYDYNPWNLEMESAPEGFHSCVNQMQVEGADYLEECKRCNTSGDLPCPDCTEGYRSCKTCNGAGKNACPSCKGSGSTACVQCKGSGTIKQTKMVEKSDEKNQPQKEHVTQTQPCTACNGTGKHICLACNGDGLLVCEECHGTGKFVCDTCKGSATLPCPDCQGQGYILHDIVATQTFYVKDAKCELSTYHFEDRYLKFHKVELLEQEDSSLISSIVHEHSIGKEEWIDLLEREYVKTYDVEGNVQKAIAQAKVQEADHPLIRQKLEVYQKNILEVTYQVQGVEYHILLDQGNDTYVVDKHPIQDIAEVSLNQMNEAYEKEQYREVHRLGNELKVVIHDIPDVWKYQRLRKSILNDITQVFWMAIIIGEAITALVNMIRFVVLDTPFYQSPRFWLPFIVALCLSIPVSGLWGWLKTSSKKALLLCGGMFGGILELLIILLFELLL